MSNIQKKIPASSYQVTARPWQVSYEYLKTDLGLVVLL
jgi:hypothetical protein